MRDKEDRVRFSGYDVSMFKVFVFCLAAALSAVGGAMFALQVGFMSPSFVGIVPSIEMVIFAAVGGRMSLVGAVYGTLLVNFGKTYFSESFPELWLFLMAALFIGSVLAFPDGLAGLWVKHVTPRLPAWLGSGGSMAIASRGAAAASPSGAAAPAAAGVATPATAAATTTAIPASIARSVSPGARSLAADRAARGAPDPDDLPAPAHGA